MAGLRFLLSATDRGTTRKAGDPINVRLEDAPLGDMEKRLLMVLDVPEADFGAAKFAGWDCAGLLKRLTDMRKAGELHPVITHPLAVYLPPTSPELPPTLVLRSLKRVDMSPHLDDVKDPAKEVEPKTTKDVTTLSVAKPADTFTEEELKARK